MILAAALLSCSVAYVYDGDQIRCRDGVTLRLAGIDAPEFRCRKRRCAPGDPIASRDALRRLAGARVRYRVVDADRCVPGFQAADRYGRPVALVYAGGRELGAAQLAAGRAIRWTCTPRGRKGRQGGS
jgi:endonuclease YncB( thermonuclease family)